MVSGSNRLPVTAPQCVVSPHEKISSRNRREEIFLISAHVVPEHLQPRRAVVHYAQNCILRSLRRFGRQLNEEISFGRFCCSCLPVPAGRNFLFQEEAT